MRHHFLHVSITAIYASLLLFSYIIEVSNRWSYLGFLSIDSALYALISILLSLFVAFLIPYRFDTRSFLLAAVHYIFLVPSFIILAAGEFDLNYLLSHIIFVVLIFSVSSLNVRAFKFIRLSRKAFFFSIIAMLTLSVILMIAYGGYRNFNLNFFRVYEYRDQAAASMPAIFSYIFSGVSKVIAPISIVLAINYRSKSFFLLSIFFIIILFGVTSHKSVIYLPVFVTMVYIAVRHATSLRIIAFIFLSIGIIAGAEIIYLKAVGSSEIALFNSFIVRRALFIPPLIDQNYVEYFSQHTKYYWSDSMLSVGLVANPYDLTAPHLIGREFFGSDGMSANTGIIGSGFAQAGYIGVALYSSMAGLFLAFLQAYGRIIGHALVSAGSLSVFISVVMSTDIITAILTHGLLLLIVLLMVFPKIRDRTAQFRVNANDHLLRHRSPVG